VHGFDALSRSGRVVVRLQEPSRTRRRPQLEVGEVDIHQSIQQLEGCQRVVGLGVVDDGQSQPVVPCMEDAQSDLGNDTVMDAQSKQSKPCRGSASTPATTYCSGVMRLILCTLPTSCSFRYLHNVSPVLETAAQLEEETTVSGATALSQLPETKQYNTRQNK